MTPSRTLALTEELIALSSITPDDKGCQRRLIELLAPLGFACETITSRGVTNLWARKGTQAPLFVFAGHTDVVPTGPVEQWQSQPFIPTRRDGKQRQHTDEGQHQLQPENDAGGHGQRAAPTGVELRGSDVVRPAGVAAPARWRSWPRASGTAVAFGNPQPAVL